MNKSFYFLFILLFPFGKAFSQSKKPQLYAMVIGISTFQDTKIPSLKYADKDAQAFAEYLKSPNAGQIPEENISLLVNEKATYREILRQMVQLVSRCNKEDLFIFFFSGHGKNGMLENSGYFLTYDSENGNEEGTAIAMDYMRKIISKCSAKMKISYIDACHAGRFQSEAKGTSVDNAEIVKAYVNEVYNADKGEAIFMSSSDRQESVEDDSFNQGIFTYFLLKGLKGDGDKEEKGSLGYDDGKVTVGELATYVTNKVSKATKFKQKPTISNTDAEFFPLSIVRSGTSLTTEISHFTVGKKEIKIVEHTPKEIKIPSDEKLSPGMTFDKLQNCYGQYAFINSSPYPLTLVVYGTSKFGTGTYGAPSFKQVNLNIPSGETVSTPRLMVVNVFGDIKDCEDKFDDYLFYFKSSIDGKNKFAEISLQVESGKKKYYVLKNNQLIFTDKPPLSTTNNKSINSFAKNKMLELFNMDK